jgi:hypothetical protein
VIEQARSTTQCSQPMLTSSEISASNCATTKINFELKSKSLHLVQAIELDKDQMRLIVL